MKLQNLTKKSCSWDKGSILEESRKHVEGKMSMTCSTYPGLDLDDPSGSLPTPNILWFFVPLLVRSWTSNTVMLLDPFWTQNSPVWEVSANTAATWVSGMHSPWLITGKGVSSVRKVPLQWSCRAAAPRTALQVWVMSKAGTWMPQTSCMGWN